jgi:hypothetical protein
MVAHWLQVLVLVMQCLALFGSFVSIMFSLKAEIPEKVVSNSINFALTIVVMVIFYLGGFYIGL